MIITYFRSSSYNRWDYCQQCYFFEYVLGRTGKSNKAADKGTIVHKVLEIMALAKLNQQNNTKYFLDDLIGNVTVNSYDIEDIINRVYKYYSRNIKHHTWVQADFRECRKLVYQALEFNNGQFDPRNKEIVSPEASFNFEIKQPWAKYDYIIDDKKVEGYLSLKGTIDLVTKVNDKTYEIIDWKTGRRINWATGEEKTAASFKKDPQLRLYHYAAHHLYPDVDQILMTIFYIKDGGPFTTCFSHDDLLETEEIIKKRFNDIRITSVPKLTKTWKCTKLCHFGQNTFQGTNVASIKNMTQCEQVEKEIKDHGIANVMKKYTEEGHSIDYYHDPGSTT